MNSVIILPLEIDNDSKKVYSFTLEFAKRIQAEILILITYNLPSDYSYSLHETGKEISKGKEGIHFILLELLGYYHGMFNQWQQDTISKVRTAISPGSMAKAILKAIKDNKDPILVLQRNHYSIVGLSEEITAQLVLTKAKIIMLPFDLVSIESLNGLDSSLFDIQKKLLFESVLKDAEIYNMPDDINLFKRHSLQLEFA